MMLRCPAKQETHMLMSTDRILVSHVGSLPRPPTLSELLIRREAGETIDAAELAHQVEIATTQVIDKQVEAGVDVGNDGEQSRVGFQTYVSRCLGGFGGESRRPPSRDQIDFPSYARQTELRFPRSARVANAPAALSDVQYVDSAPINEDAGRGLPWRDALPADGRQDDAHAPQTAMIENGFVHIPETAPWLAEYLHEMTVFPNGRHDDQADSTAQFLDWYKMPFPGQNIFELYRRLAEAAEQRQKPQPTKTVYAKGSVEWFAEQKKSR
jgi:hypothetical protein